jgi:hypothetical protein
MFFIIGRQLPIIGSRLIGTIILTFGRSKKPIFDFRRYDSADLDSKITGLPHLSMLSLLLDFYNIASHDTVLSLFSEISVA